MIDRIKAAIRAFKAPNAEPEPEPEQVPQEHPAACPKCGRPGERLTVQRVEPTAKTHYCIPCQKFYRPN